jgi:hypothetical protein
MKLLRWFCTTSGKFCTSGLFQNGVLHFTTRPEMASFQKTGKSPNVVCSLEFPIGNSVAAEFWSCNGVFKSFHLYQSYPHSPGGKWGARRRWVEVSGPPSLIGCGGCGCRHRGLRGSRGAPRHRPCRGGHRRLAQVVSVSGAGFALLVIGNCLPPFVIPVLLAFAFRSPPTHQFRNKMNYWKHKIAKLWDY